MQAESYANTRAGDLITYGREILRGFGVPVLIPTFIGTDALSHEQVVNKLASSGRSKPFLKQYIISQQRIASDIIRVGHIPDVHMPSDFLTKWVSKKKLDRSLNYACNPDAYVPVLASVKE